MPFGECQIRPAVPANPGASSGTPGLRCCRSAAADRVCGAADICSQILEVYRERDVALPVPRAPAKQEPPPPGTGASPGSASPGSGLGRPHPPGAGAPHANGHPHGGDGGGGDSMGSGGTGVAPDIGGMGDSRAGGGTAGAPDGGRGDNSGLGSGGMRGAVSGGDGGVRAQTLSVAHAPWLEVHKGDMQAAWQATARVLPAFAASTRMHGLGVQCNQGMCPRACADSAGGSGVSAY